MTGRSDKRMAAVMAAVQQFLEDEARRSAGPREHKPLSLWKSTKWRTLRDPNYHPVNLWKHIVWQ